MLIPVRSPRFGLTSKDTKSDQRNLRPNPFSCYFVPPVGDDFCFRRRKPYQTTQPTTQPCYNQGFPMAQIIPFRALRYDPQQVSVDQAVTQPYDKISPSMQDRYYAASPYNLVRIILGRREPTDNPANTVYTRAAADFRAWRTQGFLREDSAPSIYVYSQRFTAPGESAARDRRGFIALGRVEDYSAGVVFRHEQTLAKPKADRLDLLRATRAHFGQIFMLYEDSGQVESLLTAPAEPDIAVTDENEVLHRVWQVSDPKVIDSVCTAMRDKSLIIADGHHRYETALTYRNECRSSGG